MVFLNPGFSHEQFWLDYSHFMQDAAGDLDMQLEVLYGERDNEVILRNARQVVEAGGFAGFDVLRYEEGIESTRPFARRFASGEIRLVRSRAFPEL